MMEQDALEKAKERLKSNYSKARSARHGAQLCQPAAAPRLRAAPPRQRDLTREAPTLSPALKAQGWAVKQFRVGRLLLRPHGERARVVAVGATGAGAALFVRAGRGGTLQR